jgi:aryl carrier-like protein
VGRIDPLSSPGLDLAAVVTDAPTEQIEAVLLKVFRELLDAPDLDVTDNIFNRGAHSMLLLQLQVRLAANGWRVPLSTLFQCGTVRALSAAMTGAAAPASGLAIERSPATPTVLSSAEERMWFLARLPGGSLAYNAPSALELRGPLDAPALSWAFAELVRRHDLLRTRFPHEDGVPYRVVDPAGDFVLPVEDLEPGTPSERWQRAEARGREEAERPFDFDREHPVRMRLLRLGPEWHVLLLTMHHICADGWALSNMLAELSSLYSARRQQRPAELPELPIQYGDYAVWQRAQIEQHGYREGLAYWKAALDGAPASLRLPTDGEPTRGKERRGASEAFVVSEALAARVREFGRARETTMFVVLLSAFKLLLRGLTGEGDLVVGTPVSCRPTRETEPVIGLFVNTVALRTRTDDATSFEALSDRVRAGCVEAFAHQDVPFDLVVRAATAGTGQAAVGASVVQTMLAFHETPYFAQLKLEGLTVGRIVRHAPPAKFDLWLSMENAGAELHGLFEYDAELFDAGTIRRWCQQYLQILRDVMADPRAPLSATLPLPGERAKADALKTTVAALPGPASPPRVSPDGRDLGEEPAGPAEAALLAIYREVLQTPLLTVSDNIFEHGAHSLALLRLQARVQAAAARAVALEEIFLHPTVRGLCALLDPTEPGDAGAARG